MFICFFFPISISSPFEGELGHLIKGWNGINWQFNIAGYCPINNVDSVARQHVQLIMHAQLPGTCFINCCPSMHAFFRLFFSQHAMTFFSKYLENLKILKKILLQLASDKPFSL